MEKLKSANICFYLFIFTLLFPVFLFSQPVVNETLVITTYYPSPTHAVNTLEVRDRLAIDDESENIIPNLNSGQLYIGNSIILRNSTATPASPLPGEIIYNSNFNKLQFYNGTRWINASAG